MEELCAHLFQRVEKTLRRCLEDSSKYLHLYWSKYVDDFLTYALLYVFVSRSHSLLAYKIVFILFFVACMLCCNKLTSSAYTNS